MKITFRYLPVLLLFLFSCKKEDPNPDQLPPATQSGKNTFGCYVNGKVWVPHAPTLFERKIEVAYGNDFDIIVQRFENKDGSDKQTIKLFFRPDKAFLEKTYTFDEEAAAIFMDRKDCNYLGDPEDLMEGSITITRFDLEEKILAGTFEFTLDKEDCEALNFTEGRFDIRIP